eukprot:gene665-biopygen6037
MVTTIGHMVHYAELEHLPMLVLALLGFVVVSGVVDLAISECYRIESVAKKVEYLMDRDIVVVAEQLAVSAPAIVVVGGKALNDCNVLGLSLLLRLYIVYDVVIYLLVGMVKKLDAVAALLKLSKKAAKMKHSLVVVGDVPQHYLNLCSGWRLTCELHQSGLLREVGQPEGQQILEMTDSQAGVWLVQL